MAVKVSEKYVYPGSEAIIGHKSKTSLHMHLQGQMLKNNSAEGHYG